jgi:hypothetical protein
MSKSLVKYYPSPNISAWQGLRSLNDNQNYFFSGTILLDGILYAGPITNVNSTKYNVNYPNAYSTSVYGCDDIGNSVIACCGSYKLQDVDGTFGFVYTGLIHDLNVASNYQAVTTGGKITFAHSTMGNLTVGSFTNPAEYCDYDLPLGPGTAFIYSNVEKKVIKDFKFPGSKTTTAYGIWHNGNSNYTIVGGYGENPLSLDEIYNKNGQPLSFGKGYIVDYNAITDKFSNWSTINVPNESRDLLLHVQGISSSQSGIYELAVNNVTLPISNASTHGWWIQVQRTTLNEFVVVNHVPIHFPGIELTGGITTCNSVAANSMVGIVLDKDLKQEFSYQASIYFN